MQIQEGEVLLAGFGREGRTVRSECERTRSDIHGVHRPMPGVTCAGVERVSVLNFLIHV